MPLFGLPAFDAPRRRRRSPFLTPPINPEADMSDNLADDAPELPDLPPNPRPMLPPPSGIPGGVEPPPYSPQDSLGPPTRYQRYEAEKQGYMRGRPVRLKSALTGALQGLTAGGPGGALTGAAYGALDPRRVREVEFNQRIRPQIQERFGYEDQQRAQQRQAEADALNEELRRAQIGELGRRGQPKPAAPLHGRPGDVFLDPTTRQPIATIPQQEKSLPPAWRPTEEAGYQNLNAPENRGKMFRPPARPSRPARQPSLDDLNNLAELKQTAMDAWRKVTEFTPTDEQPQDTPEAKEIRRRKAQAMLDEYNRAVENFGSIYGESFETGPGKGNWNYYKPRQGQGMLPAPQQGGRQATVSMDAVRAYAAEKGIDEQEALQRFRRKKLNVRQQ